MTALLSGLLVVLAPASAPTSDGRRWYRSFTSGTVNGSWTPPAASESNPFARSNNVTFSGTAWTRDFSHGELLRAGKDQTHRPFRLRFLYQGIDPGAGGEYTQLPWRTGPLTQTNPACRVRRCG